MFDYWKGELHEIGRLLADLKPLRYDPYGFGSRRLLGLPQWFWGVAVAIAMLGVMALPP